MIKFNVVYNKGGIMKKENDWDKYFLNMCNTVAGNSKCLSRKIGAIIVNDNSIVSTGYNGAARGIPECQHRYKLDVLIIEKCKDIKHIDTNICPRYTLNYKSGEGLDICIAGHAERNALINAARVGVATKGLKMYMNCPISCKDCLTEIINAGIEEIIVTSMDYYDEASKYIIKYSDLKVCVFDCDID